MFLFLSSHVRAHLSLFLFFFSFFLLFSLKVQFFWNHHLKQTNECTRKLKCRKSAKQSSIGLASSPLVFLHDTSISCCVKEKTTSKQVWITPCLTRKVTLTLAQTSWARNEWDRERRRSCESLKSSFFLEGRVLTATKEMRETEERQPYETHEEGCNCKANNSLTVLCKYVEIRLKSKVRHKGTFVYKLCGNAEIPYKDKQTQAGFHGNCTRCDCVCGSNFKESCLSSIQRQPRVAERIDKPSTKFTQMSNRLNTKRSPWTPHFFTFQYWQIAIGIFKKFCVRNQKSICSDKHCVFHNRGSQPHTFVPL